jgi:predicted CopG family antitoxin
MRAQAVVVGSMTDSTTIRIDRDTLQRLHNRKESAESHDDLLNRLIDETEGEIVDD